MASRLCWSIYSLSWDSCSAPSLAGRPGGRTLSSPPAVSVAHPFVDTCAADFEKAGNVSSGMTFLKVYFNARESHAFPGVGLARAKKSVDRTYWYSETRIEQLDHIFNLIGITLLGCLAGPGERLLVIAFRSPLAMYFSPSSVWARGSPCSAIFVSAGRSGAADHIALATATQHTNRNHQHQRAHKTFHESLSLLQAMLESNR